VLYRSYLWAIGIPMLVGFVWIGTSSKAVKWGIFVAAVLLVGSSFDRVQSLRSEISAWGDAAKKVDLSAPANALGRWRPLVNYGNQLIQQERFQQAAQLYENAVRAGDVTGIAEYHLGLALLKLGKYPQAVEAFARAESKKIHSARNPGLTSLYTGQALFLLERYAVANQWLDQAIPLLADNENKLIALEMRAKANLKQGIPQAAIADYTRMTELAPEARKHRIGLALAMNANNQAQAAMALLDQLLKEADNPDIRSARIIVMLGNKQMEQARSEMQLALSRYPGHPTLQQLARKLGL